MATLILDKTSYIPGETIYLTLDIEDSTESIDDVINVSIDFFRIDVERNQFAFGFGTAASIEDTVLSIEQALPKKFASGVYGIFSAVLCRGKDDTESEKVTFSPVFFTVRTAPEKPISNEFLRETLATLNKQRTDFINHTITTKNAKNGTTGAKHYTVLIFGVGCLISTTQQLSGFAVTPLKEGLSHKRMHEVVDTFLVKKGHPGIEFNQDIEKQFEHSTPTLVITYSNVKAYDHTDAIEHCQAHSQLIFLLLGFERGQLPRQFCTLAMEIGSTSMWYAYHFPGYRGNLLTDFNPCSTANQIERLLPKLEANPWVHLLMKTYSEASAEEVYEFRLLRYWTILEMVSVKHIKNKRIILKHPNGKIITKANGQPHKTNSRLGKVYQYILNYKAFRQHGTYHQGKTEKRYLIGSDKNDPGYTSGTELISLWEVLNAIYEIRNSVAHTGQFNIAKAEKGSPREKLAARFRKTGQPINPLDFIKHQAQMTLWREI